MIAISPAKPSIELVHGAFTAEPRNQKSMKIESQTNQTQK